MLLTVQYIGRGFDVSTVPPEAFQPNSRPTFRIEGIHKEFSDNFEGSPPLTQRTLVVCARRGPPHTLVEWPKSHQRVLHVNPGDTHTNVSKFPATSTTMNAMSANGAAFSTVTWESGNRHKKLLN